jgi:hypothetical protein
VVWRDTTFFAIISCFCWISCWVRDVNKARSVYSSHIDTQINVGVSQITTAKKAPRNVTEKVKDK